MGDYLRDCNSGTFKIDDRTFHDTWCVRCSKKDCDLAGFIKNDPMAVRQATWREKFFNPVQADTRIPKFARIAEKDFPDLLRKAVKLEISERRGDWSVPEIPETVIPNVPIMDGISRQADKDSADTVDQAVRKLAESHGKPPPGVLGVEIEEVPEPEDVDEREMAPCPICDQMVWYVHDGGDAYNAIEEAPEGTVTLSCRCSMPRERWERALAGEPDIEPEPEPAPVQQPPRPAPPRPRARNVPDRGGVMLGGAKAPPSPVEEDPWAAPARPKNVVVKSGARIQFGAGGKGKVIDE